MKKKERKKSISESELIKDFVFAVRHLKIDQRHILKSGQNTDSRIKTKWLATPIVTCVNVYKHVKAT